MKAAALFTPFLVLGLLHLMHRLEVWTGSSGGAHPPRKKVFRMTPEHQRTVPVVGEAPLLRDPPPPPGYVEPLAGSSAEDTLPGSAADADTTEPSRERSSTTPKGLQRAAP